jgi:hypothetical protein
MDDVAVRRSQEREPAQIDPVQSSRVSSVQNAVALKRWIWLNVQKLTDWQVASTDKQG